MQQEEQEEQQAERKARQQALCVVEECATGAAKLALTLAGLSLDIYEAVDSLGASAIVGAPLMELTSWRPMPNSESWVPTDVLQVMLI